VGSRTSVCGRRVRRGRTQLPQTRHRTDRLSSMTMPFGSVERERPLRIRVAAPWVEAPQRPSPRAPSPSAVFLRSPTPRSHVARRSGRGSPGWPSLPRLDPLTDQFVEALRDRRILGGEQNQRVEDARQRAKVTTDLVA
jgi:hypothetical protein